MGDRIRIGELLAAIGTIGLAVSLVAFDWFEGTYSVTPPSLAALAGPSRSVGLEAGSLGWFAFASLLATLLASIVFFLRALTGRGPERASLQAPIAYLFAGFSLLVLLVRVFLFQPAVSPDVLSGDRVISQAEFDVTTVDVSVLTGGYLGVFSVFLIVVGLWIAMSDDRTESKAAKARTAALLADVPIRSVPHVPAPADADASVIADDAVPTDPTTPPHPASGGPA